MTQNSAPTTPAIEGGNPVRSEFLPFFRPAIDQSDIDVVTDTLKSGWLTLGPKTQELEKQLSAYLGAPHVSAVSSCTAAMFLALKALGVGPGDEVVTSPQTFASTVQCIMHCGATPVLADIEMETFGVSPEEIEKRTTDKTKVYLPVHFGGQACRIDEIVELARDRSIAVVEDAAHSFGAEVNGRKVGTIGDATAFSFYATKNLTTGEGGALSTADQELDRKVRQLSYHGMSRDSWNRYAERGAWYYEVDVAGYKYNMSDILSALGLAQLGRFDELLEERRRVASRFLELMSDSPYFEMPRVREGNLHTWHLFVVLLNLDRLKIDRDAFTRALAAENVGCSVHFISIHEHPFFKPYLVDQYPAADAYFSRCISLPIFPGMDDRDVEDVVAAMNRIASYYAR